MLGFLFLFNLSDAYAKEFYKVYNKGILDYTNISEYITEDTEEYFIVDTVEVEGIDATNNFKIDDDIFQGTLKYENNKLELRGTRDSDTQYLTFSGEVLNEEGKTFTALLEKEVAKNGKRVLYVNINSLDDAPLTFVFNDKNSETSEIKNQKRIKEKFVTNPLLRSAPTRELMSATETKYLTTGVFGTYNILRGSYNNYTVRSTTNTDAVTQLQKDNNWSVWGTKISHWSLSLTGPSGTEYETKNPTGSGDTSFSVPAYLPYIGLTSLPITTSKTTVSNNLTNKLKYEFSWPTYGSAHPGDNVKIKEKPKDKALAVDFALKTESVAKLGTNTNTLKTVITYTSNVYNANTPNNYVSKTYDISQTWIVNLYD